jgi:Mn2+/Fe2+ NRAMP family transporter
MCLGSLSTSYGFGDFFGLKHSLHCSFRDAKEFYLTFTGLVVVAAAIVLIPGAPRGVVTEAVQALAGLLLPSASVFLPAAMHDREVLGPRVAQHPRHDHHCRAAHAGRLSSSSACSPCASTWLSPCCSCWSRPSS